MWEIIGSWYSKTRRVIGICYSSKGSLVFIFFFPCSEKKRAYRLTYNVQFISGKSALELDPYAIYHTAFSFLKHYL